jgi:hypothetical protein
MARVGRWYRRHSTLPQNHPVLRYDPLSAVCFRKKLHYISSTLRNVSCFITCSKTEKRIPHLGYRISSLRFHNFLVSGKTKWLPLFTPLLTHQWRSPHIMCCYTNRTYIINSHLVPIYCKSDEQYVIVCTSISSAFSQWGAGIAQSVQQWGTGWMAGVQFLASTKKFFLLHSIQTSSGVHPASYPMGTWGSASEAWSWPLTSI